MLYCCDVTGSAADVCELLTGDEIVSVNGAQVGNHYLDSVKLVLAQAARTGQVELVVNRSISQGEAAKAMYKTIEIMFIIVILLSLMSLMYNKQHL